MLSAASDLLGHLEKVICSAQNPSDIHGKFVAEVSWKYCKSARMMSAFTGIPDGARASGLPPNMPVSDFGGR